MTILRVFFVALAFVVAGPGSQSFADPLPPPSGTAGLGSPIFTFSGGNDVFGNTGAPVLEGSLLGNSAAPGGGVLTGFSGTMTAGAQQFVPANPASGSGFTNAGSGTYTGSSGQWAVDGFNFRIYAEDPDNIQPSTYWLYSSDQFSGSGTMTFSVSRAIFVNNAFVVDGSFRPTVHTYSVVSTPEIDGAVFPRAAAIIGGFAMLILLGARQKVHSVSSDG